MNFLKALFGGEEPNPEEEKKDAERKRFDLMKYDGVKAMKIGQWDYAVRCFEEALSMKEDLEVRDYLSHVLVRLDRMDEAIAQMNVLVEAEPENADLLLQAAHVYFMKEDYDGMAQMVEKVIALEPASAKAYYLYAQGTLKQGDLINGIARLTKAIALDEEMGDARLLRAQTLLQMGDVNGAAEDSQWLMEHVGEQEDVLLLAARVAHVQGNDDEAIHIYNKVVETNPFVVEAYAERGKICYDRGDKQQAEADMQKVLELNPQQMADVSGDYSAEGVEHKMKQAYSNLNPFGL
jgi:tetratricopeptide (TPR) repeat protein